MLLFPLLACALPPKEADTAGADTADTAADTDTADPTTDTGGPCDDADAITGVVEGGWSGDGQSLLLRSDSASWSDGCYGGDIDGGHRATDGAFSWRARIYASGGGPEPRDVRAVGCVSAHRMELSITETDGTPFWGPWVLTPDPEVTSIQLCD